VVSCTKKFERILQNDRQDYYSLLSLANIYRSAVIKDEKRDRYRNLAKEFYLKVLAKDPKNIYAANGLAIVEAERGNVSQAKDFLIQIREATADIPDVWINLAHVYLKQGQYVNAIKLYQNVLKKFYENKDPEVLCFLAKAYFESEQLEECKRTLMRAIHVNPSDVNLWYNLAVAQKDYAAKIMNSKNSLITDVSKAIKDLELAFSVFNELKEMKDASTKRKYSTTKCTTFAKLCASNKEIAITQLEEMEERERHLREDREKKEI